MARVFGFDIGTTSIGSAVIDYDPERESGSILHLGTRIFPEARDPDGTPLNQSRRQKRMARRQLRRRRMRRRRLNEILAEAGLLPPYGGDEWTALMATDPYELRRRAVSDDLAAHELGRVLYHLGKRRHFLGREVEDEAPEDDADEKAATTDRDNTEKALKDSGQTLGAWLSGQTKKRGRHATRAAVTAEFDAIWDRQKLGDGPLRAAVRDAVFEQRPVFWRKSTLIRCQLMPDEPPCPKAAWISQQRRMLEKLNNLAVAGGNGRELDAAERGAILAKLQTQASMTWGGVRKALAPLLKGDEKKLRFNLEQGGDRTLLGNPLEAKLARIFGAAWAGHSHKQAIREAVPARLWEADFGEVGTQRVVIRRASERKARRAEAARAFAADFALAPDQAEALAELPLSTGWEPYSTKALQACLPHLEAGERFGTLIASRDSKWRDWRVATFPDRDQPTGEFFDKLPSPAVKAERDRLAGVRNPTVVRVQNELRKVVNNLIAVHGKPDLIRVEVAREVGKSKRDREAIQAAQRRREAERKKAVKDLEENNIANPTRDAVEKWLLWKECGERCPYSGDSIGFNDLFGDLPKFDVEHIWPRSLSFDDSFANKTLCRRDINQRKGNRIPFAAFGSDEEQWARMTKWVGDMQASRPGANGMSAAKVRRFLAKEMPTDFANRQLTDTGYAARQAVDVLKRLWPDLGPEAPVNVQTVSGRVTAQLRRFWGLNNVLADDGEKTRADHRHHAIDALVVACAHPGMTQRLSRFWQAREGGERAPDLSPPWWDIRADADEAAAAVVVSHRVRKKISGPLHKETVYGDTGREVTTGKTAYRVIAYRVPIAKLTKDIIDADDLDAAKTVIRDGGIRAVLRDHVARFDGDLKKAMAEPPTMGPNGPEIRTVRLLTKQQSSLLAKVSTGLADFGNNHHIAIYRLPDGRADYDVVPLFEASRRLSRREPVVRRDRGDGSAFVMSLSQGDALEFPDGGRKGIRIVQSVWASGVIVTVDHRDATGESVWRPSAGSVLSGGARKVSIDPLGRIRPAND